MDPSIISRLDAGPAISSATTAGKLAALKKRAYALKQQLSETDSKTAGANADKQADASPAELLKSGAITQQIGYVESQIDQLLLASQLARLGSANPADATAATPSTAPDAQDATDPVKDRDPRPLDAAGASSYRPAKRPGKYVSVRA